MRIIVEGIDRVGKSTLCSMLQKELSIPVYKDRSEVKEFCNDDLNTKFTDILTLIETMPSGVIFDRMHMTEFVYDFLRGDLFFGYPLVDNDLAKLNCTLILVLSTDIEESSRQHGSDLSKHENLFLDLYKKSAIKDKIIVTYSGFENLVNVLKGRRL